MKQQVSAITMLLMMGGVCAGIACRKPSQAPRETIGTTGSVASPIETPTLSVKTLTGQVTGAGAPIAGSTVTLWAAGADAPQQLAQTRTGDD